MPTRQTPLTARSQHLPKHLCSTCQSICAAPADAFALADVSGIRIAAGVRNIGGKIKSSEAFLVQSAGIGLSRRGVQVREHRTASYRGWS